MDINFHHMLLPFIDQCGYFVSSGAGDVSGSTSWRSFTETQVQEVVAAIDKASEDNWLKDYIFPICSALFAAVLGGLVAVYVNRNQEIASISKERVNTVNELLLRAEFFLNGLNEVKRTYYDYVKEGAPPYRIFSIPILKYNLQSSSIDTSSLGFLLPRQSDKDKKRKWSDIARINAMFGNYQFLINCLNEISQKRQVIDEVVAAEHNMPRPQVNIDWLRLKLGVTQFTHYFFQYEFFIKLNDDLIIELSSFLTEFGQEVNGVIGKTMAKRYGLIIINEKSEHLLLNRCHEPYYEILAREMQMTVEEVKQRLKTNYPVND